MTPLPLGFSFSFPNKPDQSQSLCPTTFSQVWADLSPFPLLSRSFLKPISCFPLPADHSFKMITIPFLSFLFLQANPSSFSLQSVCVIVTPPLQPSQQPTITLALPSLGNRVLVFFDDPGPICPRTQNPPFCCNPPLSFDPLGSPWRSPFHFKSGPSNLLKVGCGGGCFGVVWWGFFFGVGGCGHFPSAPPYFPPRLYPQWTASLCEGGIVSPSKTLLSAPQRLFLTSPPFITKFSRLSCPQPDDFRIVNFVFKILRRFAHRL